jgi:hypothetical protein
MQILGGNASERHGQQLVGRNILSFKQASYTPLHSERLPGARTGEDPNSGMR